MTRPKFNANVARWIEPHDTPAKTERDYYEWYGTQSKQWGADGTERRLYDWAAYARFILLGHPAALSNCPVRGHPDDYEDKARAARDDERLLAADATERTHFTFIMDADVPPAERQRRIIQVIAAMRIRIAAP